MIAQYLMVDNALLEQLQNATDTARTALLESMSEQPQAQLVDLGKLWDIIHFVLTKHSATQPVPDEPVSEFVVGVETFSDSEDADFIAFTPWAHIVEIVDALEQINFKKRLEKVSMKSLREQAIFPPNIWQDKKDNLDKELLASYNELLAFYNDALDNGDNIVVSIL